MATAFFGCQMNSSIGPLSFCQFNSTHMYNYVTISNRVYTYRQSLWYLYSSHILQTSTQPNTKLSNHLQTRNHANTLCISIFVFWTCLGVGVKITYISFFAIVSKWRELSSILVFLKIIIYQIIFFAHSNGKWFSSYFSLQEEERLFSL
jgi:hypothetical protein